MRLRSLAATLAFLATMPALAHDAPVPPVCLVAGTTPTVIATFSFTPQQLATYQQRALADGICIEKDCGIVDEWFWANKMATAYCAGQQQSRQASPDDVSFNVNQPAQYNSTSHHADYHFSSGNLTGACYVCASGSGKTVTPRVGNDPTY